MSWRAVGVCGAMLAMRLAVAAPPAVDVYGRLPSIETAALSPDGSKIALISSVQEDRLLSIITLADEKLLTNSKVGDTRVRGLLWADDEHLLLDSASNKLPFEMQGDNEAVEWNLLTVFDLKKLKIRPLLGHVNSEEKTMNAVYGPLVVHHEGADTVLYVHGYYVTNQTQPGLFRIDLTSGVESLAKRGENRIDEWVVDDDGRVVADQAYSERERRWTIDVFSATQGKKTVSGIAPIDEPEILGLTPSGDALIVSMPDEEGNRWQPLSISDGTWGSQIAPGEAVDGLIHRHASRRMVGTAFFGDSTHYRFTDPLLQEEWDWIERVFAYQRLDFISASQDYSKILVQVMGGKFGYAYYVADYKDRLTRKIGNVYNGLTQIAEVRPIHYAAADGLQIPGYLTLPPGRPEKHLPLIVMPHGGPEARDVRHFDWWAQALAAQGYAVLQPNFRGSDLDQKWVAAGYGEWGRKMQTDLSDGVRYLAAQGIVDSSRACIVGASYGGYAALAGVTLQSGIYRCAVAVAGISDPASFMNWIARKERAGTKMGQRYFARFLGAKDSQDKSLEPISPLRHADALTVPLLLIHGRDDVTVPYDQSTDLLTALKRANKSVELVTLDQEDHYLSRSATRLQMLQATVDFLRRNNPPE